MAEHHAAVAPEMSVGARIGGASTVVTLVSVAHAFSHAYGALVNELGIAAPGYATQDIDVARHRRLQLALPAGADFRSILADSGLEFVPVPGMPSHRPSASFKVPGVEALSVDVLVPGRNLGKIVPLAELRTHAQEVPLLDFLLRDSIQTIVLGPCQCSPSSRFHPPLSAANKEAIAQNNSSPANPINRSSGDAAKTSGNACP